MHPNVLNSVPNYIKYDINNWPKCRQTFAAFLWPSKYSIWLWKRFVVFFMDCFKDMTISLLQISSLYRWLYRSNIFAVHEVIKFLDLALCSSDINKKCLLAHKFCYKTLPLILYIQRYWLLISLIVTLLGQASKPHTNKNQYTPHEDTL